MNRKLSRILTTALVLLCLALLGGSIVLFVIILPKKQAGEVTSLETSGVFDQESSSHEEFEASYEPEPQAEEPPEPVEEAPSEAPAEEDTGEDDTGEDENLAAVQSLMAGMTTEEKIWQLFYVTPEALTGVQTATLAGDATKSAIETMPVGGIIYFADNLESKEQVQLLLSNTQSYSAIPLFLGVDEEGGIVSRVCSNAALWDTPADSAKDLGKAADPAKVYEAGSNIAQALTSLGFNMDFAPVADVKAGSDSAIGSRSFGTDASLCASFSSILARALHDGGILSCGKHFPGYGAASADAHDGATVITKTLEELEESDLVPFETLIAETDIPFLMVGHVSYTSIVSDGTPADCSSIIVTDILRNKLGFDNVIITDSQQMASITDRYTSAEAAVAAFRAGCDMILMPENLQEAFDGITDAVESGAISEARLDASVQRILLAKARFGLLDGMDTEDTE